MLGNIARRNKLKANELTKSSVGKRITRQEPPGAAISTIDATVVNGSRKRSETMGMACSRKLQNSTKISAGKTKASQRESRGKNRRKRNAAPIT